MFTLKCRRLKTFSDGPKNKLKNHLRHYLKEINNNYIHVYMCKIYKTKLYVFINYFVYFSSIN